MSAANIVISQGGTSGVAGVSRDDLVAGAVVTLTNASNDGVQRLRWRLVDRPSGSTAALVNAQSSVCTFTPDVPGSYLVELAVDEGARGQVQRRIAAVREDVGGVQCRMPAAGERDEANWLIGGTPNTRGWTPELETWLRALADGGGPPSIPLGSHAARSIVGRAANSSGDAADIVGGGSASDVHVFSDNGTTVASRSLLTIIDSDAARWSTIQDIDMGAWASTDFTSGGDGTVSVGGLTWNKANVAAADGGPGFFRRNAADVGDDGGGGVRILHDASLSTTLTTAANSAPHLWIALSTLDAAYDESAEYVLQLHVTRLTETGSITNSQPTRLAMLLHAPAGTPPGTPVRVAGVAYRRNGVGDWRPCIETSSTTDTSRSDQAYNTSNVLSLHFGPRGMLGFSGLYSGGWPSFASLTSVGFRASAQSAPNWADVFNHRSTRVSIVAASGVSNTGSIDVMFRRMRLLRRRA
jgi:hypothetical protein